MHSYSYSSASFTLCVARRLYYQWSCIQWVIFDSRSFAMLLRRQKPLTCTRENCKGQHRLLCNCMIMSLHCVARWWCDFDEFYIFYSRYLWAGLPFNRAEFLATFCIHITVIHRHRHNYCFWRVYGIDKLSKRRVGLIKSREVKGVTKDNFSAFVINQNWLCILINTLLFRKCPLIYMTVYRCWPKKTEKQKQKKISAASQTVVTVRNAPKICQGHKPNIWLTLFQISSKSVHFRRSYSRMREDRFLPHRLFFDSWYRLFEPRKKAKREKRRK